jgi:phage gpG-like protein
MTLRGDDRKLEKMIGRFRELSSPPARADLSQTLSHTARGLVDEGFRAAQGPTGGPWKRPLYRSGPPLQVTRELRGSFELDDVTDDGFALVSRLPRALRLQEGGEIPRRRRTDRHRRPRARQRVTKLTPRRMVPDGKPGRWRGPLRSSAQRWMTTFWR